MRDFELPLLCDWLLLQLFEYAESDTFVLCVSSIFSYNSILIEERIINLIKCHLKLKYYASSQAHVMETSNFKYTFMNILFLVDVLL